MNTGCTAGAPAPVAVSGAVGPHVYPFACSRRVHDFFHPLTVCRQAIAYSRLAALLARYLRLLVLVGVAEMRIVWLRRDVSRWRARALAGLLPGRQAGVLDEEVYAELYRANPLRMRMLVAVAMADKTCRMSADETRVVEFMRRLMRDRPATMRPHGAIERRPPRRRAASRASRGRVRARAPDPEPPRRSRTPVARPRGGYTRVREVRR